MFDLVNGDEDNSEDARDESSTEYQTCSSGSSTPSELSSSDFVTISDVSSEQQKKEKSAEGIHIFVPGLDR